MRTRSIFCISTLMMFLFVIPAQAMTLRTQWVPQTQFAGYYMALEKGFYKKAGIDLEIRDGGPGLNALREVSSGDVDFATGWLISAMRLRAKGEKLVLIGQVFQRSALLLLSMKSSGIDSVEKFSGHSMGVWPGDFQLPPKALIRKDRIRNVKIVDQGFSMEPFIKGDLNIASAMMYNEYHQVLEAGVKKEDLVIFNYGDLGMNLPEDGIYAHESLVEKDPALCRKFMEATFEGWRYAFDHKDETAKFMTALADKTEFKTTEKKQRLMLDEVERLIDLESFDLKKTDFETALEVLKSTRIIREDLDMNAFVMTK